jgi:TRAP transporter 4TM/12TM fusion protein
MVCIWAGLGVTIFQVFRLRLADRVIVDLGFFALLVALFLPLVFLAIPAHRKAVRDKVPRYDYCLAGLSAFGPVFVFIFAEDILMSVWPIQPPPVAFILGLITWALVLEGVRRTTGWILTALVGLFSIYPLFASHLPPLFFAKSYSLDRLTGYHFLSTGSIFGLPMNVFGSILIGFMLFGVALGVTGGADFLLKLAQGLVGRLRGAPALVAVMASAMLASLSGSAVANVISTGSITIPAMKKLGYEPEMAGAIESCASTGGVLTPPVMGASAFVMAALLEIPYSVVCLAAAIPVAIYYVSLFAQVYLHAERLAIPTLSRDEIPSLIKTLKQGWFYLGAVVFLAYTLFWVRVEGWAPYYATAFLIVCSFIRRATRPNLKTISRFTISLGHVLIELAPVLAGIGLILGSFSLTGVGQTIGTELMVLAGQNLYLLLLMGAVAAFILGMGMPMLPVFIFMHITFAPAFVSMGVPEVPANLFLLYWAMVSFITPPVCIAVYSASAIAGSNIMQTGLRAVRLGIVAYIIPFVFVFNPALTGHGTPAEVIWATVTALTGAAFLAIGAEGYLFRIGRLTAIERAIAVCSGFLLLHRGFVGEAVGVALALTLILGKMFAAKRNRTMSTRKNINLTALKL